MPRLPLTIPTSSCGASRSPITTRQPTFIPIGGFDGIDCYIPGEPGWNFEQNFYEANVIFNNNAGSAGPFSNWSSVVEIVPPMDAQGNFTAGDPVDLSSVPLEIAIASDKEPAEAA